MFSSLSAFIEGIVGRLAEFGISDTPLQDEWTSIERLDPEEREFCLAAARLGIDSGSLEGRTEAAIIRADESLHGSLRDDFLDAVDPSGIDHGINWVGRSSQRITSLNGHGSALPNELGQRRSLSRSGHTGEPPWDIGYAQARRVRKRFKIPVTDRFPVEELIPSMHLASDDAGLIGLGGTSPTGSAAIVLGRDPLKSVRRFLQARALWHFTGARSTGPFLITNAGSTDQKINRAFAAELLAPAQGIKRHLREKGSADESNVEYVARGFGVPTMLIHRQIQNQLAPEI